MHTRSRKLYNLNPPSSKLRVPTGINTRSKIKVNSKSSKIFLEHNNSPASACDSYELITTTALIEPLPECRGKCSVPFNQSKSITKLRTLAKIDLDEIKIVSSSNEEPTINNNNNTKELVKMKKNPITNKRKPKTTQMITIQTRSKKPPKVDTDAKEDQFTNTNKNSIISPTTKNRQVQKCIYKTRRYSGNTIKRNRKLSVESILDEKELTSSLKKSNHTIKNKKQPKFVPTPLSFNPIRTETKSPSSSSVLPELVIELERLSSPVIFRRFLDSDVPVQENIPMPKIQIFSNILVKEKVECVPNAINSNLDVIVENNLEGAQQFQSTPIDLSALSNLPYQLFNERIICWLQTPDMPSTEIVRLVEAVLSKHAHEVKLLLGSLGPANNPVLCDLHDVLMKQQSTLDEYFKKKK